MDSRFFTWLGVRVQVGIVLLLGGCGDANGEPAPVVRPSPVLGTAADGGTADLPGARAHSAEGFALVILGNDTVHAEVADTPEARERGLMHRTELAESEGMLFVYSSMATRSFWMRNTLIPLDIAFLDDGQVIVDIQHMEPETDTLHTSTAPAMFALEVPRGWFASRGIEVGAQARIVFERR
jgi:uncharacterized protein